MNRKDLKKVTAAAALFAGMLGLGVSAFAADKKAVEVPTVAVKAEAAGEPNTLSDKEKAAGWKLLFDGKSADQWRGYNKKELPKEWQVIDGALVRKGGGDIVTPDGKLHVGDPKVREAAIHTTEWMAAAYKDGYVPPEALSWNDADDNNGYHEKLFMMDFDGTLSPAQTLAGPNYPITANLGKQVGAPGNIPKVFGALKTPPIYVTFNGSDIPTSGPDIDFPLGNPMRFPSKTHHLHGSPVYWDGAAGPMLFVWGENESLRAWKIDPASGRPTFVGKGAEVASAQLALQRIQPAVPEMSDSVQPLIELGEARRIQLVNAVLRLDSRTHEPRLPEHLQMLRDRRRADLEPARDFTGAQLTGREQLDDAPAGRVGERAEDQHSGYYSTLYLIK